MPCAAPPSARPRTLAAPRAPLLLRTRGPCLHFFIFYFCNHQSLLLSSSTRRRFYPPLTSGQVVVTVVVRSPPPDTNVPSFFFAQKAQRSHFCPSILWHRFFCQLALSHFGHVNLLTRVTGYFREHSSAVSSEAHSGTEARRRQRVRRRAGDPRRSPLSVGYPQGS